MYRKISSVYDGALLAEWFSNGETMLRHVSQPDRLAILKENAELRRNPDALRSLSFMGMELRVPVCDLIIIKKNIPELDSPDRDIRRAAWAKFMRRSDIDLYRVRDRHVIYKGKAADLNATQSAQ